MQSILLAASILCADTVIKKKREQNKEPKVYLNGHVHIMTYHNQGAFLNSGEKNPFLLNRVYVQNLILQRNLFLKNFLLFLLWQETQL